MARSFKNLLTYPSKELATKADLDQHKPLLTL